MTTDCFALRPHPSEIAWKRAMKLAQVPEEEWSKWPKPRVSIVWAPRYLPKSPTQGMRLCGEFVPFYENGVGTVFLQLYVRIYVRPTGERDLLIDTLTHEFLHLVWAEKLMHGDEAFIKAHPDSEEYVVSLIPNTCPNV